MSKKKPTSARMFKLQLKQDWSDEDLGMLAIAFIYESGLAKKFLRFLKNYVQEAA